MKALNNYLRNHWAAAAAGVDLADRTAARHRGDDLGDLLDSVAAEIRVDRTLLGDLMRQLEVPPGVAGSLLARGVERLGRLKPNGRLIRRSPVSDLLELEALRGSVLAKRAGWEALAALAGKDQETAMAVLPDLCERADRQIEQLTRAHRALSSRVLGSRPASEPAAATLGSELAFSSGTRGPGS